MTGGVSGRVPVASNEAIVEGRVIDFCLTSSGLYNIRPEQVLYKLTVFVETIEDVENLSNHIRGKDGQPVVFFTKVKPPSDVFGKRIRIRVEYKGDERGGRFWIKMIEKIY